MTKFRQRVQCGLFALGLLFFAACNSGGGDGDDPSRPLPPPQCGTGVEEGPAVPGLAEGRLYYLKRQVDPDQGLGSKATARKLPVREAEVEAVRESDCLVTGSAVTGADGRFRITIPAGQRAFIRAYARRKSSEYQVQVLRDKKDPTEQSISSVTITMNDGMVLPDLVAGLEDPDRPAGAFNIFQVLLDAIDRVKTWNGGETPPLLTVYWFSGNNAPSTTYSPGSDSIQLIGGRAGRQDSTDTDEFDDGVILHEFGHFLVRHYSRDDNPGGYHGGEELDPRLAYAEGLVNFLSALLRDQPDYVDTYGTADDTTGLLVSENLEDYAASPAGIQFYTGIGSEESVEVVLWDFYDATAVAEPFDTLSAGAPTIWEALQNMARESFIYVLDFAEVLSDQDPLNPLWTGGIEDILAAENIGPFASFPPVPADDPDFFPAQLDLSAPVLRTGAIDSTWVYANGETNLSNGSHSSDFYGFTLTRPGSFTTTLTITGPIDGLPLGAQPHDLDLRLYNRQGQIIASAVSTTAAVESISLTLSPGEYLLEVAGDFRLASFPIDNPYQGQTAQYRLTAAFTPDKKQAPLPLQMELIPLEAGRARLHLKVRAPLSDQEVCLELLLPAGARVREGRTSGRFRLQRGETKILSAVVELEEAQWRALAGRASLVAGRARFAREVYPALSLAKSKE